MGAQGGGGDSLGGGGGGGGGAGGGGGEGGGGGGDQRPDLRTKGKLAGPVRRVPTSPGVTLLSHRDTFTWSPEGKGTCEEVVLGAGGPG